MRRLARIALGLGLASLVAGSAALAEEPASVFAPSRTLHMLARVPGSRASLPLFVIAADRMEPSLAIAGAEAGRVVKPIARYAGDTVLGAMLEVNHVARGSEVFGRRAIFATGLYLHEATLQGATLPAAVTSEKVREDR